MIAFTCPASFVDAEAGVNVWDLRLIRANLAAMGLDWGAPPYPEPPAASATARPIRVEMTDPSRMNVMPQ